MTTTSVTCDRCHEAIESGRVLLQVQTGPSRLTRPEVDLCGVCWADLLTWLAATSKEA